MTTPFIKPTQPAPTPIEKTLTTLNLSAGQFIQTQRQLIQSLTFTWNNPFKLTPQEVVAGLGTSAVSAFNTSAATVQWVSTVAQINGFTVDAQLTALLAQIATYTITENADGTVTITK